MGSFTKLVKDAAGGTGGGLSPSVVGVNWPLVDTLKKAYAYGYRQGAWVGFVIGVTLTVVFMATFGSAARGQAPPPAHKGPVLPDRIKNAPTEYQGVAVFQSGKYDFTQPPWEFKLTVTHLIGGDASKPQSEEYELAFATVALNREAESLWQKTRRWNVVGCAGVRGNKKVILVTAVEGSLTIGK